MRSVIRRGAGLFLATAFLASACSGGAERQETQETEPSQASGPVVLDHGPISREESCTRAIEAGRAAYEDNYGLNTAWLATQSNANGYGYVQDDEIRANLSNFVAEVAVRELGRNLTVTRGMLGYEHLGTIDPYADYLDGYSSLSNLANTMIQLSSSGNEVTLQNTTNAQTERVDDLWTASNGGQDFCKST